MAAFPSFALLILVPGMSRRLVRAPCDCIELNHKGHLRLNMTLSPKFGIALEKISTADSGQIEILDRRPIRTEHY
jgi:hypothetical protein